MGARVVRTWEFWVGCAIIAAGVWTFIEGVARNSNLAGVLLWPCVLVGGVFLVAARLRAVKEWRREWDK